MWGYAAAAVCAVGAMKVYLKTSTGWCRIDNDLMDRIILVTGGTSGVGKATAVELAKHGASVHITSRNLDVGRAVVEEIQQTTGNKNVQCWKLDLSSLKSVREFAGQFLASGQPLHVLINNAGIGGYTERRVTEDGLEMTMASNHFGHYLLTSLLFDRLKSSSPSRIVNVSSTVHHFLWSFPLDDVNFERSLIFSGYWAYCRSKLANVMFTKELSRRIQGTGVSVYSLHPGTVRTNLFKERPWYSKLWLYAVRPFYKTPLEGAQTTLYVATTPNIEHTSGGYYSDCAPASMNRLVNNDQLIREFFDLSARITGAKW